MRVWWVLIDCYFSIFSHDQMYKMCTLLITQKKCTLPFENLSNLIYCIP